jgi:hypothetical protein
VPVPIGALEAPIHAQNGGRHLGDQRFSSRRQFMVTVVGEPAAKVTCAEVSCAVSLQTWS